ncbi:hypothetical protein lerEdw1_007684 [Lerista edwardsae]|nr:hypothetical protein lerEdw1_007684 [Lerista edwardsae]
MEQCAFSHVSSPQPIPEAVQEAMEPSATTVSPTTDSWNAFPQRTLEAVDVVVLVLYFVFVLAVGLWSMWKTKRSTVKGYFLAGGEMVWWPKCPVPRETRQPCRGTGFSSPRLAQDPGSQRHTEKLYTELMPSFSSQVGASLFASNVGSGHFIGLAGSGAAAGIAATAYEWNGMFCVLVLAWLFLPIYMAAGVDMYAGALFIQQALHWDLYVAVIGLLGITAIYTVAGGLAAVIYTDTLQTVIMLAGALTLMGFSEYWVVLLAPVPMFHPVLPKLRSWPCVQPGTPGSDRGFLFPGFAEVGSLEELQRRYFTAVASRRDANTSCGLPREDAFHIFRDPVTSDLPWPGVLVGMTVPSLWYWCTDQLCLLRSWATPTVSSYPQVIVQRSLAAKSLSHAKGGALLASYLKILPLFMMVLPGMISRILFPGLRGLMMSVMIAALMSSLTSIFNSASTIFTMDLWRHLRPLSSEWELMVVGRVFVLLLVVISILWIPLVQASQGGQLFIYIQTISSYLQPPVAVVFILGCFWRRTNEKGAFCGLLVGMVLGLIRMVLDFVYMQPRCDEADNRPAVVKYVHYLYFSVILTLVTLAVVVAVSLLTEPPPEAMVSRLTWFTRRDVPAEKENPPASAAPSTSPAPRRHEEGSPPPPSTQLEISDGPGGLCSRQPEALAGRKSARLTKVVLWICGMDSKDESPSGPAAATKTDSTRALPEERPLVKHVLNINLIVCLTAGVFLWAFFA